MDYREIMEKLYKLPRDQAHKIQYKLCTGRELDLDNPKDLDEKIQWLMVNRYDKNVSAFADKYLVREYVRQKGFESILPKLYGVYTTVSEIDLSVLPNRFVLKANHGSGDAFLSICQNKEQYDYKREFEKLSKSLHLDYSKTGLEYHYAYIEPKIICEEYIEELGELYPPDYKFFCFSGEAKYLKVVTGRGKALKHDYFDANWNHYYFMTEKYQAESIMEKPKKLEEMLQIASALSMPFSVVRIDLYCVKDKIYFGEITLTPETGMNKKDKKETLEFLGSLVDLSYWKPQELDFMTTVKTPEKGIYQQPKSSDIKKLLLFENAMFLAKLDQTIDEFYIQSYDGALRNTSFLMGKLQKMIPSVIQLQDFFREREIEVSLEAMTGMLQGFLQAQENRDYVLLADLLELQLHPFLIQLQESLVAEKGLVTYDYKKYKENYMFLKQSQETEKFSLSKILNNAPLPKVLLDSGEFSIEYTSSGFLTFSRVVNGNLYYYHSNGNPYSAGRKLALSWYKKECSHYIIIGLGFAYHALALTEYDDTLKIDILEPDLKVLQLACAFAELKKLLSYPNVQLYYDPKFEVLAEKMKGEQPSEVVIHAPTLESLPESNSKISLQNYFAEYSSLQNQERMLNANFRSNVGKVKEAVDVLEEKWKGKDIFLVAAGPSLDKNLHQLKLRKQGSILLAVGTVFRKLMKDGIRPDYVVISDANERVLKQIEGLETEQIPLILLSTAYYGFAEQYQGACYLAFQKGFPEAELFAKEKGFQLCHTGGSVATLAFDLAIQFGCKRVIALGLDLSYPNQLIHASGTSERELTSLDGLRMVEDIEGQQVPTARTMDLYRHWIEKRIKEEDAAKIEFFDATEGGAKIYGMTICKLMDVIE